MKSGYCRFLILFFFLAVFTRGELQGINSDKTSEVVLEGLSSRPEPTTRFLTGDSNNGDQKDTDPVNNQPETKTQAETTQPKPQQEVKKQDPPKPQEPYDTEAEFSIGLYGNEADLVKTQILDSFVTFVQTARISYCEPETCRGSTVSSTLSGYYCLERGRYLSFTPAGNIAKQEEDKKNGVTVPRLIQTSSFSEKIKDNKACFTWGTIVHIRENVIGHSMYVYPVARPHLIQSFIFIKIEYKYHKETPYVVRFQSFTSFPPQKKIRDVDFEFTFDEGNERDLTKKQEKTFKCSHMGEDERFSFSIPVKDKINTFVLKKDPIDLLLACNQRTAYVSCDGIMFQNNLLI